MTISDWNWRVIKPSGRQWRLWSVLHRWGNKLYWCRLEYMDVWHDRSRQCERPLLSFSASTVWEPRDLWIGVYWDRSEYRTLFLYICLLPCLPLRLHFKRDYGAGGVS